jgi:hypothetical protein
LFKCAGGVTKDCDDADPCTDDSCDPTHAGCLHKPNEAPCDDGEPCTLSDTCEQGSCVGEAIKCDDGNNGTTDVCYLGKCFHQANACETNEDCSDGESGCTIDACVGKKCQFTSTGAAGCCNGTPWANSFETVDLKGIVVSNSKGAGNGWQLWDKPGDPPLKALYYGDAKAENYVLDGASSGHFMTPQVKLPAGRAARLAMWLWMDTEGGKLFDALRIEVVTSQKTELLWQKTAAMPLQSWRKLKLPLTKWAGEKIAVQVTFETFDELKNDGFGVLVDNLAFEVDCASTK